MSTRIIHENLTPDANAETLTTVLGSTTAIKRRITGIASETQATNEFRLYVGQDKLIDISTALLNTAEGMLPVDIPLDVGITVKAGYNAGGTNAALDFSIAYDEG